MNLDDIEPTDAGPEPIDTSPDEVRMDVPAVWRDSYTDDDKASIAILIEWLNAHRRTQVSLARQARITPETFSQVLRGKYPSSPTKHIAKALETIATELERQAHTGIPFVETTVWRLARSVYHRARTHRNMGVLSASSGTGKTKAAQHYETTSPGAYLIECTPKMSVSAFLDALIEKLSLAYQTRGASCEKKLVAIIAAMRGTDSVLIVDEAENLLPETLEYSRRIRDLAQVGVVLQGKPDLLTLLSPKAGKFDQIRSRITFWPDMVQTASRADADEIALAAFADIEPGPDRATLDALWAVGGGSLRVLCEGLIPNIRDFGLRKGRTLSAQLVHQIAKEAMRMPAAGRQGAGS